MTGPLIIRTDGRRGTLSLGGVELQDGIRGFSLDAIVITSDIEIDGQVKVVLTEETHRVLVALGWTPPADSPSQDRQADHQ